jgi:hypothetical protein
VTGQGCDEAFWASHTSAWFTYTTGQDLDTVFDPDNFPTSFGNNSLLEALAFTDGGGVAGARNLLAREAVAALLNASHPSVDYPYTEAEIIALVDAAFDANDETGMRNLAADLNAANNLGCPGDVSGDGNVTSADAAIILQLDAGTVTSVARPRNADVNRDGSINSIDSFLILQLDAGLIHAFPAGVSSHSGWGSLLRWW